MSIDDKVAAIAARYGAGVAPGATITRIPQGASSRPLPIWNGRKLIVPDWKEQIEAQQRAGVKSARKAKALQRAKISEVDDRLLALRRAGASARATAEAVGLSLDLVCRRLKELGEPFQRDPVAQKAAAKRMMAARAAQMHEQAAERNAEIARMAARGFGEDQIGAALGIGDRNWLRKLIRRAVPTFPFINRRRGRSPKAEKTTARKRAVHVARNSDILSRHRSGETVEAIAAALSVTRLVVVRVLTKTGELPTYAACRTTAHLVSELPALIAKGWTTQQIASRWRKSDHAVYQLASRAGVSLRPNTPPPHNVGKVSDQVLARRAWVRSQVEAGATDAEILAVLKIHQSTLSDDIQALGLSGARRKRRAEDPQSTMEQAA